MRNLEPVVFDALTVSRQVLEGYKTFEMVDRNARYLVRLSQPEVDSNAPPPFAIGLKCSPVGDATAVRTEVKAE